MNVDSPNDDYQRFLDWKKKVDPVVDIWQSLNYFKKTGDDLKWFVKVETNKTDEFCVYFSNLIELWSEELTYEDFETKLQALNPNLEGGDAKIFTKFVKELMLGRQTATITATFDDQSSDEGLQIQFRTKYSGVPFRWEFNGCKCTTSEAKKQIVDPLLMLLMQYQRREMDLMEFLLKKDREIDAFKATGARLTRKNLETPKFQGDNWSKTDEVSEAFLDTCRDFRADRCHPFQDLRVRSLSSAAEVVTHYLEASQLVNETNESGDEAMASSTNNDVDEELPKLTPMKRTVDSMDDDKDEEPDTTTSNAEPRSTRKKKILRL